MDYEDMKQWLKRGRNIDYEIKDKLVLLEALYSCCGIQGISYERVSVISSPENKLEKNMANIDKIKRDIEMLQRMKEEAIYEISQQIDRLKPSPERTILMQYYVGCWKMEKIAGDIGYELSYCYQLKKKGIEKLCSNG